VPVRFYSNTILFKLSKPNSVKSWINNVFVNEGVNKKIDLNYIFCTDNELLEINKIHLNHDYFTDIITFPIEETDKFLEAEIYISIDRVKDNATELKVDFNNELYRVIIHGVLHLCGYNDKTAKQESLMRERETYYISQIV
jgi:probable rRNA maturation factor